MAISDLSDKELDQFEANYRRTNKTEGGKYSLSEILLEKIGASLAPSVCVRSPRKLSNLLPRQRTG